MIPVEGGYSPKRPLDTSNPPKGDSRLRTEKKLDYITEIAYRIHQKAEPGSPPPTGSWLLLYRGYAVLCLTTGQYTDAKAVHDMWSLWAAESYPQHRSLVPFDELTEQVQDLDIPYRDAIRAVAYELGVMPTSVVSQF